MGPDVYGSGWRTRKGLGTCVVCVCGGGRRRPVKYTMAVVMPPAIMAARFAVEDEVVGVDVEREVGMTGKLVDH